MIVITWLWLHDYDYMIVITWFCYKWNKGKIMQRCINLTSYVNVTVFVTLWLHDPCLEVHGTELRLFWAKAFSPTHTIIVAQLT